MKRRLLAAVAALATATLLSAGSALAIPIPGTEDQNQDGHSDPSVSISQGSTVMVAQTFTAGMSGSLGAVEIYVNDVGTTPVVVGPNAANTVTVELRTVSGSDPTSTVSASVSAALIGDQWNAVFFSSPPAVTLGTKYAIVIYPDVGQFFQWGGTCTAGAYSGGGALVFDTTWKTVHTFDTDLCIEHWAFRTYVTAGTPPPTTTLAAPAAPTGSSGLPLLLAGAFAAIAFVTLRRVAATRH
jgi:hypothetical protein